MPAINVGPDHLRPNLIKPTLRSETNNGALFKDDSSNCDPKISRFSVRTRKRCSRFLHAILNCLPPPLFYRPPLHSPPPPSSSAASPPILSPPKSTTTSSRLSQNSPTAGPPNSPSSSTNSRASLPTTCSTPPTFTWAPRYRRRRGESKCTSWRRTKSSPSRLTETKTSSISSTTSSSSGFCTAEKSNRGRRNQIAARIPGPSVDSSSSGFTSVDYNGRDYWSSVALNHPANFGTMAMDIDAKKELIEDLNQFIRRREYYRRVGKAWKRGYLLYGPPGTGKSSLVAAMANYLKFDVYDLDLREVQCNSDLRRLLIGSANRSILVIEDIDCNVGLHNREPEGEAKAVEDDKITLSGLLNFIDGLWSSCGDERIIVFTTNHKDRLDPALLRPGRMDLHIHMSCCTFDGFKILASNYLQIEEHPLFGVIEKLLVKVQATPAEVAGQLMKNDNADMALQNLIEHLQNQQDRMTQTQMK